MMRLRPDGLTTRETEVLQQLTQGLSNKEIACALSISNETVKTHVANILAKLGAASRSHAAVLALKSGMVALDSLTVMRSREVN
jgi:two-component system, NarL family, response regulator LiaR